jgi:hypothetical protein
MTRPRNALNPPLPGDLTDYVYLSLLLLARMWG